MFFVATVLKYVLELHDYYIEFKLMMFASEFQLSLADRKSVV